MGGAYRSIPGGNDWIAAKFKAMQAEIDALKTAGNINNSTISNGGQLQVLDINGNVVATIGHDSAGIRGMALTSPDGVDMLDFFIQPITGIPFLRILDSTGQACFVTDPTGAGFGIGWPWLQIPFGSNITSLWPGWNTSTFSTIANAGTNKASQSLFVECGAICDSGATAGQIRLLCNGNVVGSTINVNTTGTGGAQFTAHTVENIGDYCFLELQARVTAGTGLCKAEVHQAIWTSF